MGFSKYVSLKEFTYLILNNTYNTFEYFDNFDDDGNGNATFIHKFKLYDTIYINNKKFFGKSYCFKIEVFNEDMYNIERNKKFKLENKEILLKKLDQFKTIKNALKLTSSLKYLYINTRSYENSHFLMEPSYIFKLISNNKLLNKLKLNYIGLKNKDLIELIKVLKNNNCIQKIDLDCNIITSNNLLYKLIININSLKKIILNSYAGYQYHLERYPPITDLSFIDKINIYFKNNHIKKEVKRFENKIIIDDILK